MQIEQLKSELQALHGRASFVSCDYTAKLHGERARYTLLVNANYRKVCENDLLELELQLKNAQGVRRFVILDLMSSLRESIRAIDENRWHVKYTKAGLYTPVLPGLKLFVDGTLEIQGLEQARKIIVPGNYRQVNSSPTTLLRNEIRRSLRVGKFKTLCVDVGNIHAVKLNGTEIAFEQNLSN